MENVVVALVSKNRNQEWSKNNYLLHIFVRSKHPDNLINNCFAHTLQ